MVCFLYGVPGGILTRGLRSRSPTLYTAGLRAHKAMISAYNNTKFPLAKEKIICYTILAMRKWLRGRASPCQGEGREFESRLPLQLRAAAPRNAVLLYRGVAQFGSVLDWGSRGLGFKSRHSDQKKRINLAVGPFSYHTFPLPVLLAL